MTLPGKKTDVSTARRCLIAIRFLADFENAAPLQIAVVVGLDLFCDALAEGFPQCILAARVQHLLLDGCCIRAPAMYIIIITIIIYVRLCMDMFNCDDVATLLTKRKQKFAGSFARIDSILCELVVVISD